MNPRRPSYTLPLLAVVVLAALLLTACDNSDDSSSALTAIPSPTASVAPSPTPTVAPSPTASVAPSPTPTVAPSPTSNAVSPPEADGEEAYKHVVALSQRIGSRPAGSSAESAAADYIADQLVSYGYRTMIDPFEVEYYVEQAARLQVLAPDAVTLEARALRPSASGETTGDLVSAGIGQPGDFPPEGMDGRIALVQRGELTFSDKVTNAVNAGASAVIVYNNETGLFQGDLEAESAIPAIGISQEDGARLIALLNQEPVSAQLSVEAGLRKATSRNVIARPPDGSCERLVGAHYDSVEAGPGANDNASGVGALLETARVLALAGGREGVCFAAFGAEEVGLVGSRHFVSTLGLEERRALEGMVNLDMVGVGDVWWLFGSAELVADLDAEAATLGIDPMPVESSSRSSSDQNSFIDAGMPAVLLHRFDDPRYHTAEDQAGFVEPRLLEEATEIALLALLLLGEPDIP